MANQYSSELSEQRKVAVAVLDAGLATVAELAGHFGLARQTVQRWADASGVNVGAARAKAVAEAVQNHAPVPSAPA